MYLDALLPDMAFTPGDIPMLGDSFMPTCTVSGFPGSSLPGLLDELNHLEVEHRCLGDREPTSPARVSADSLEIG
jgi:type IV secretion system protein VirB4